MKIVGITLPYSHLPFERALQGLAAAGYRYVGFGLRHEGEYVPPLDAPPEEWDRVAALCERYGLKPMTIFARAGVKDAGQTREIEIYRRELDQLARIGIPYITGAGVWGYRSFPDVPLTAEEMAERHRAFVQAMQVVGEHAAQRGVTIALKPHTGDTATAPILLQTLAEIDRPAVKAFYDPGNVRFYEGLDPAEDILAIKGDMPLLCAKDHRGARAVSDFPVPGEGEVNFPAIFAHLRSIGFDGAITVERIDGPDNPSELTAEEIDARMRRARENLIRLAVEAGYPAPE